MKKLDGDTIKLGPQDSAIVFRGDGSIEASLAASRPDVKVPPSAYMVGIVSVFLKDDTLIEKANEQMLAWIKENPAH